MESELSLNQHDIENESGNDEHVSIPQKNESEFSPFDTAMQNQVQEAVQIIVGDITINLASSYITTDALNQIALTNYQYILDSRKTKSKDKPTYAN